MAQGWYIGMSLWTYLERQWLTPGLSVAYSLGIYLLNLFLAFLQPKFDPSNEVLDDEMEGGSAGGLPTKQDEEFRPFIRRLPEFKFWHSATRAITIGFFCTWFSIFDVPVFWPVLVIYWLILFTLTSMSSTVSLHSFNTNIMLSEETNPTHDQIPLRPVLLWQGQVYQEQLLDIPHERFDYGRIGELRFTGLMRVLRDMYASISVFGGIVYAWAITLFNDFRL
jgi:hypothetical protein